MTLEELKNLIDVLDNIPAEDQEITMFTKHVFTYRDKTIVFELFKNPDRALVSVGNEQHEWNEETEEYALIEKYLTGL
ncbi:MAG: hypothetical protein N4A35_15255 [Flavobacteriales bacterium]|jgi:hypothetical protein|nr:hypothetical protein [Flavobacteriales bacterium]